MVSLCRGDGYEVRWCAGPREERAGENGRAGGGEEDGDGESLERGGGG